MLRKIFTFTAVIAMAVTCYGAGKGKASEEASEAPKKRKQSLHEQYSGAGYGLAGCGLGSILFGQKPGGIQIISATTNGIWSNNTFGVSSGTSNCDIPEMGQQAGLYIEVNREIVQKEAARGEGETISGLAEIFNCSDVKAFGTKLQQNYNVIFGESDNSYNNVRKIYETIQNDSVLRNSCTASLG